MNSINLTDRKYHSLFVGNLSKDIRTKELIQYLQQFDEVDQCQLFEGNQRRCSNFAFVLMRTPDSINRLMSSRPHFLDNRRLYLKRLLSEQYANKVAHYITTENIIIQFKNNDKQQINEPNFNEDNIRTYFQTYGNIRNLIRLKNNRCIIEYNDYDSVDCILLDSPHYFNSFELQIDKYYTNEQIKLLERMFISNNDTNIQNDEQLDSTFHSYRHLNTTIRLLNDSILSVKIANEIKLETIQKGFLSTIHRRKQLIEQIQHLNKQCQILFEKNQLIKENNCKQLQINQQLEENYQQQIQHEQNQWKNPMDSIEH